MKIKEIGKTVTGKTPSTKQQDNYGGKIMFITPEEVSRGYYVENTNRTLSNKGFESIKNNTLDGVSVLVNCIGNIGDVSIVEGKCATNQQINAITDFKEGINPLYVYYKLKQYKNIFNNLAGNTVLKILPKSIFDEIDIEIPDIDKQNKVSRLLNYLDRTIYNNNNINIELESMAKTIYDYWFLQYEFPNKEGKPYKSSGGKMVYNEELKKEVPEGWNCKKIGDIEGNIVTGKTPSTKDEKNFGGTIPFITIDDIRQGLYISNTIRTLSEKGANLQVKKYIPEDSICVTCIATVGLVGITTQESQTNQQINSIVCENKNNLYYLVNAIKDHFKYSSGAKTGNVFDNMNKEDFSSIKVVHPTENVLKMYKDKMQPLYDNIKSNILENQELTKLRDYLLPLLMNGQVSFKN